MQQNSQVNMVSSVEFERIALIIKVNAGAMRAVEAAQIAGCTDRHFRRLQKKYKEGGEQALLSRKRGKSSNRKWPKEMEEKLLGLLKTKYNDFSPFFAFEKLDEDEEIKCSAQGIRNFMIRHSLWHPKQRKRINLHQTRQRRPYRGSLIQIDGSLHDWFEGRVAKCVLLVAIDDATSQLMLCRFVDSESTQSYFDFMYCYIDQHGIPEAIYTDKHGVFSINHKKSQDEGAITQMGRSLQSLGIRSILANTPQAKGRVERMNRTLQGRLIKELKLAHISSQEEANIFLREKFIPRFNQKFSVPPLEDKEGHKRYEGSQELKEILSCHEVRVISKELSFSFNNAIYVITDTTQANRMRNKKIQIVCYSPEEIRCYFEGKKVEVIKHRTLRSNHVVMDRKTLNNSLDRNT